MKAGSGSVRTRLCYDDALRQLDMNNCFELFTAAAEQFAARTAVELQRRDCVDRISYNELREVAERAAVWLIARGIGRGRCVALLADNDPRWAAAFLGVLQVGSVAVPLDTTYGPAQVATILRDSGAVALFGSARYLDTAHRAVADIDHRCHIALLHGRRDDLGDLSAAIGPAGHQPPVPRCPAQRHDPAVILYTSGTTSDPKGVTLTHGNLLAEREAALELVRIDEHDAVLSVLPLFHALALLANLFLPFSVGARVVFLEQVNVNELLRALAERDITALCCVPQFFYLIHQRVHQELAGLRWSARLAARSLARTNGWLRATFGVNPGRLIFRRAHRALGSKMRLLVTGGSRFDPAVHRQLYNLGFTIRQAYGLTECSGAATLTSPGDRDLDAVGRPLPGVEIAIAPRRTTGDGVRDGEVLIRGAIVMTGYFNRPDQTAAALRDGWLHTGDLGYLDAGGRLHLTGRQKEVIVLSSGKNIYPEEIEAHYERSPFIKEVGVVGLPRPHEPAAERLCALVRPDLDVLRERRIVNVRELLRFEIEGLSVELPSHKRILGFHVTLDELPRTTTRKLKRFELERLIRAREAAEIDEDQPRATAEDDGDWRSDPHVARALDMVRQVARPNTRLRRGANLELDLGLDSLERVELLALLTGAFGTEVSDTEAQRIFTLDELVEAVRPTGAKPVPAPAARGWDQLLTAEPAGDPFLAELSKRKRWRAICLFAVARVLYLVARLTLRLEVRGLEHVPRSGPLLISPNHQSYVDPFLVIPVLPFRIFRRLFVVGASEYFETPFLRWLARVINVVPVDADAHLVRAMQAGACGLRLGKVLILFPEGERSIDGTVKTFRKGAAILSLHLGIPIVPVAIDGAFDVWPRNRGLRWRTLLPGGRGAHVLAQFGAALAPDPDGQPDSPPAGLVADAAGGESRYAALTDRLRGAVVTMWHDLHARRLGHHTPPGPG